MMNPKLEAILAKYKVNMFELQMVDEQNWTLLTDHPGLHNTTLKAEVESTFPVRLTLGKISDQVQLALIETNSKTKTDAVNHPPHYNSGRFEVIEVIEDWFPENYHRGNALKYIARAGVKVPSTKGTIEDLEKARWYLAREIELIKAAGEKRDAVRPNDMRSQ